MARDGRGDTTTDAMASIHPTTPLPAHEDTSNLAFADPQAALAQLERYTTDLKRTLQEREHALRQIEQAHLYSLTLLSRAAELRDDETAVHMDRVGALSELLARLIGRSAEEARMIRMAAPMHDIGKIAVPDAVLKKPGGYTVEERQIMCNHTYYGAEILGQSDIPLFRMAADIAMGHHECWDGSGYPAGLQGRQIPWSARVVALIDYFDALTMDRVYRRAFSDEQVLRMVHEQRARKFDPDMVDVFLMHLEQFAQRRDAINAAAQDQGVLLRSVLGARVAETAR